MDLETLFEKTPATVEEIKWRVGNALARHPRCRNVEFDIISMPRTRRSNLPETWRPTPRRIKSWLPAIYEIR